MKTDIIKTAAAVADLLREEPLVAKELVNHFDGQADLIEALGLAQDWIAGITGDLPVHSVIEEATAKIVANRK